MTSKIIAQPLNHFLAFGEEILIFGSVALIYFTSLLLEKSKNLN